MNISRQPPCGVSLPGQVPPNRFSESCPAPRRCISGGVPNKTAGPWPVPVRSRVCRTRAAARGWRAVQCTWVAVEVVQVLLTDARTVAKVSTSWCFPASRYFGTIPQSDSKQCSPNRLLPWRANRDRPQADSLAACTSTGETGTTSTRSSRSWPTARRGRFGSHLVAVRHGLHPAPLGTGQFAALPEFVHQILEPLPLDRDVVVFRLHDGTQVFQKLGLALIRAGICAEIGKFAVSVRAVCGRFFPARCSPGPPWRIRTG